MLQALRGCGSWLVFHSVIHPTDLCRHLYWSGGQCVELLDRGGRAWKVMGGCVRRALDHIHSRHILVILVPLCPRGQFCPHLLGSHISQLLVWRDWCPSCGSVAQEGLHRAGVWALFQEPALSPPPQHLPAESSNKSHCAHV